MTRALTVWCSARLVGHLTLDEFGEPQVRYHFDWLVREDALPISVSLPLQEEAFTRRESIPFFEGLPPEESERLQIAQILGVSHQNAFKLLVELGGEMAGALSLWPEGTPPPAAATGSNAPLSDAALIESIKSLPLRAMLADTEGLRLSLAGAESRLPVVCTRAAYPCLLRENPPRISSSHPCPALRAQQRMRRSACGCPLRP